VLKKLHFICALTKEETLTLIVSASGRGGHLEVCEWLHDLFQYKKEEIIACLKGVCCYGRKEVLLWLIVEFKIIRSDLINDTNNYLKVAWDNGKENIANILFSLGGLTKEDAENIAYDYLPDSRDRLLEMSENFGMLTKPSN
jgi:hypothetical protein